MDVPPAVGRMGSVGAGAQPARLQQRRLTPQPDPNRFTNIYLAGFLNKPQMPESLKSMSQTAPVLLSPALGSPSHLSGGEPPGSRTLPRCPNFKRNGGQAGRQAPA